MTKLKLTPTETFNLWLKLLTLVAAVFGWVLYTMNKNPLALFGAILFTAATLADVIIIVKAYRHDKRMGLSP